MGTKRCHLVDEYNECRTTNKNQFNKLILGNGGRNQPKSRLMPDLTAPVYRLIIRCLPFAVLTTTTTTAVKQA